VAGVPVSVVVVDGAASAAPVVIASLISQSLLNVFFYLFFVSTDKS